MGKTRLSRRRQTFLHYNIFVNPSLPLNQRRNEALNQLLMPDLPMPQEFISLRYDQHRRRQFPINIVQPQDILPTPNVPGYIIIFSEHKRPEKTPTNN